MSNSLYIDINAKNAVNVNESNNRFTYRLPNAINLPTGTEIGMQSSILNLKGITGASVELQEDFIETVIYQYYAVDTTYESPVFRPMNTNLNDLIQLNLICDLGVRFGAGAEFPVVSGGYNTTEGDSNLSTSGYSENIMPLITQLRWVDGTYSAVPCLGKSQIRVPKGVYSINKIAELISNQITANFIDPQLGLALADNFYKYQKLNNRWNGYTVNNSTCRNFVIQNPQTWTSVSTGAIDPNTGAGLRYLDETQLGALDFTATAAGGALDGLCSILAVTPETANLVRANAQAGGFGAAKTAGIDFASIAVGGNPGEKYRMGFEKMNSFNDPNQTYQFDAATYNPFASGLAFGTTGLEIKYDLNNSGFSISKLHEPRRLPTVDRYGTAITNAGQECIYNKQVSLEVAGVAPMTAQTLTTLNALMTRISGIAVINWSFDTAFKEGDRTNTFGSDAIGMTDEQKRKSAEYANYSAFFTTTEKAKAAWEKTLWYRLGFQYDEIQNDAIEGAGSTVFNWFQTNQTLTGFTTDQSVDESITPQTSTLFNPLDTGHSAAIPNGPGAIPQGETPRGALNAVSSVQFFNLENVSVPSARFNNNTANAIPFCVAPYQNSFYREAVMIPVVTVAKDFVANELPTLSENGYVLVTSDIVEPTDVIKNQQNTGILDLIPKSNLSNQDYIADRNIISHTLSNPKTINEISIAVLNPDMTDINLEPDSSFLLRITLPIPKPTNFLSSAALNVKGNQVSAALNNLTDRFIDGNKQQNNIRIDIDNMMGTADAGNHGLADNDINQIEGVIAAAGGLQPPALPADPGDDDPDGAAGGAAARLDPLSYRSPRFQPILPPVEEALLEPREGAEGRVGANVLGRGRGGRGRGRGRGGGGRRADVPPVRGPVALAIREQQSILAGQVRDLPNAEAALENLQRLMDNFADFARQPDLTPNTRREVEARRGVVEQAIQSIEATGVLPQQFGQAGGPGRPPQPPQPPSEE